jgi:hypothetical protein
MIPLRRMTRPPRREAQRAPLRRALSGVAAAVLVVAAAGLGVLVADRLLDRSTAVEQPTPTPTAGVPDVDVAGEDLPDLARYPGAIRTAYLHEPQGTTTVTVIDYVVAAELDDVRAFYRRVFREEGWELIELDFSGGEWIFLVERGNRAALVEIEGGAATTTIEIELEEPIDAATPRPRATPTPRPPPPPPPPGDDDGDDD